MGFCCRVTSCLADCQNAVSYSYTSLQDIDCRAIDGCPARIFPRQGFKPAQPRLVLLKVCWLSLWPTSVASALSLLMTKQKNSPSYKICRRSDARLGLFIARITSHQAAPGRDMLKQGPPLDETNCEWLQCCGPPWRRHCGGICLPDKQAPRPHASRLQQKELSHHMDSLVVHLSCGKEIRFR